MKTLKWRNVNGLFPLGVDHLLHHGSREESRAGDVIVAPTPVCSIYERPTERVLFSEIRNANPFFHLIESLWMLAGRDDAATLNNYVRDFGERFAEKGGRIHGAYGWRWRRAFGFDQLNVVVDKLRKNPQDRQCVIQMWDAQEGHSDGGVIVGEEDLTGNWRDRPCNTHVYLRVRKSVYDSHPGALDLTVCCRSNDIVMGAYGANAVQFSMLQEYLAGRIGVDVGVMYQISNNYHGYVRDLDRIGDPVRLLEELDPYDNAEFVEAFETSPIGDKWEIWDDDLKKFMRWHDWLWGQTSEYTDISVGVANQAENAWFAAVPVPMAQAMWLWRRGHKLEALDVVSHIAAPDWRAACVAWIERRIK